MPNIGIGRPELWASILNVWLLLMAIGTLLGLEVKSCISGLSGLTVEIRLDA